MLYCYSTKSLLRTAEGAGGYGHHRPFVCIPSSSSSPLHNIFFRRLGFSYTPIQQQQVALHYSFFIIIVFFPLFPHTRVLFSGLQHFFFLFIYIIHTTYPPLSRTSFSSPHFLFGPLRYSSTPPILNSGEELPAGGGGGPSSTKGGSCRGRRRQPVLD
mmetsp:Transcript_15434/g.25166  ORF Transcript_15434/g.25166 Transcript_15434/m.25166 type:complete len:158 (+) Transcript_15434:137-610(+)